MRVITGTADEIIELLAGPRQQDAHCRAWRWHLYIRDDDRRWQAVMEETRRMIERSRAGRQA